MTRNEKKLALWPAYGPRQEWEAQFVQMAALGDDHLLDESFLNQWDENDWTWQSCALKSREILGSDGGS